MQIKRYISEGQSLEAKIMNALKQGTKKDVTGVIGTDNYKMKNCPFHLPKENLKLFTAMQTACEGEPYNNYAQYGNAYVEKKKD